jgi:outer membrane protein OmpA-like peptidoglycan-associated protein
MSVIFAASNNRNVFVPNLKNEDLLVLVISIQRPILSLDLISSSNRVPIDIVFLIDQTASMKDEIQSIKDNIYSFCDKLRQQGLDFQLGMIRFSDIIEWQAPGFTSDVGKFAEWVNVIEAGGGGDIPENDLEALEAMAKLPFRDIAIKIGILVTDAPCFQRGDIGDGETNWTMKEMGDHLYEQEIKLLSITPPDMPQYTDMALLTEGAAYDIQKPFDTVLTGIIANVTSLYALRYLSQSTLAPDSVRIDLIRAEDRAPLASRKLIALEEGRRFVFEDLLFAPNQAGLAADFVPELERVVRLMHVRPTMRVRVEGHADSSGSHQKNIILANERAQAVSRYLVQSGINPSRIESTGYGDTRPIATNATEEGRRLNRRTEFLILQK